MSPHRAQRPLAGVSRTDTSRRGQAMLESLMVLTLLMGIFFFFFDFAYSAVARLLMTHGAARVARAESVGFNRFHRLKALRVATIPVAGERRTPARDSGRGVAGPDGELALVRTYLQSENEAEANGILDYERWDSLRLRAESNGNTSEVTAEMTLPALLPHKLAQLFGLAPATGSGEQTVRAHWAVEDHASYYLNR